MKNFPIDYYGIYITVEPFADLYYRLGKNKEAADIAIKLANKAIEDLKFYQGMGVTEQQENGYEIIQAFETIYRITDNCKLNKDTATVAKLNGLVAPYEKIFARYLNAYKQQEQQQTEMMRKQQEMMRDTATQAVDSTQP